tara:strand:+ start:2393 stop:3175 length:783 start_codon:yes stop_codon:yes gene_type:complete
MKKVFFIFLFILYFCNPGLAETYYFKECKISEELFGDYIIDFNNNIIEVNLKSTDGASQKLLDKIKSISKDQIVSELLQSRSGKNKYFQYYLEVKSKSVIKQNYIRENKTNLIRLFGPKEQSFCANVKANWDEVQIKEAEEKRKAKIKAEEERKIEEEKEKQAELERKKEELRKAKEKERSIYKIKIEETKWIKLSKYNSSSGKKLKKKFDIKASELCAPTGDGFDIIEKTVIVIGMDETPAFGTETKILLGIEGKVVCK